MSTTPVPVNFEKALPEELKAINGRRRILEDETIQIRSDDITRLVNTKIANDPNKERVIELGHSLITFICSSRLIDQIRWLKLFVREARRQLKFDTDLQRELPWPPNLPNSSLNEKYDLAETLLNIYRESLKQLLNDGSAAPDLPVVKPSLNGVEEDPQKLFYQTLLNKDLCGVSISGGGIRSATYGLGVLQGFAAAGLLGRFDYLSTVSGGGYIGGWLCRWIQTTSLGDVTTEIKPARFDGKDKHIEANEIRHLRQYSNYLTPRLGMFSLDTWMVLTIYLRNIFLNQLVLISTLCSLIFIAKLYIFLIPNPDSPHIAGAQGLFATLAGIVLISISFWRFRRHALFVACTVFMAILSALIPCGTWWMKLPEILPTVYSCALFELNLTATTVFLLFAIAQTFYAFLLLLDQKDSSRLKLELLFWPSLQSLLNLVWLITCLALTTSSLGLLPRYLIYSPVIAMVAPILFIAYYLLGMFLLTGIKGPMLDKYQREVWISFGARLNVVILQWLIALGLIAYGPDFVHWVINNAPWELSAVVTTASTSLIFTGLQLAYSSYTKATGKSVSYADMIANLAPFLFFIALILALSYGIGNPFEPHSGLLGWLCDVNYSHFSKPICGIQVNGILLDMLTDSPSRMLSAALLCVLSAFFLANRIGVNAFSLHEMYANRLTRCFLGATNSARQPNVLTNLDENDDFKLSDLSISKYEGPLWIVNAALNRTGEKVESQGASTEEQRMAEVLTFQDRKSESFTLTHLHCGSEATGYCATKEFANDITCGTAMAVSGAAASPNMGYHSSPVVTAFLTFFNMRLGAWFGNPSQKEVRNETNPPGFRLLLNEFFGKTTADSDYIFLSDGGHFENTGIYELIKRRCRFIVAIDTWADPDMSRENLGRLVRLVRVDMGINIDIDLEDTRIGPDKRCKKHFAVGRIHYGDVHPVSPDKVPPHNSFNYNYDANQGVLIYLKVGITGDEPNDILHYQSVEPEFPHHSINDQFFDEAQFESYRKLGLHTVEELLEGDISEVSGKRIQVRISHDATNTAADFYKNKTNQKLFERLYERWQPSPAARKEQIYTRFNEQYIAVMRRLEEDCQLNKLFMDLFYPLSMPRRCPRNQSERNAEIGIVIEMFTLLGSVWIEMDLEKNYLHPINSGWRAVFDRWLKCKRVVKLWRKHAAAEFSKPFVDFVAFAKDNPA